MMTKEEFLIRASELATSLKNQQTDLKQEQQEARVKSIVQYDVDAEELERKVFEAQVVLDRASINLAKYYATRMENK